MDNYGTRSIMVHLLSQLQFGDFGNLSESAKSLANQSVAASAHPRTFGDPGTHKLRWDGWAFLKGPCLRQAK
jgi:hypothetical protein